MNQNPQQMYQQAAQAAQDAMNGFASQQPYNADQFYQQAAAEAAANGQPYQQGPYQQQAPYQGPYAPPPPPQGAPQPQYGQCGDTQEQAQARSFLGNFIDYLKNGGFKRDIDCTARQYNVPPKQLAQNFLEKCLGTVGDILGIAISTAGNAAHTLIDVLSTLAHGAANIVVNVASGLVNFLTLNKTCVPC